MIMISIIIGSNPQILFRLSAQRHAVLVGAKLSIYFPNRLTAFSFSVRALHFVFCTLRL